MFPRTMGEGARVVVSGARNGVGRRAIQRAEQGKRRRSEVLCKYEGKKGVVIDDCRRTGVKNGGRMWSVTNTKGTECDV